MSAAVGERLGAVLRTLWSGWAGLAAVCLLAALWQAGHEAYGPFVLTAPLQTVGEIGQLAQDPEAWRIGGLTLQRALTGFALAAGAGTAAGLVAGYSPAFLRLSQPLVTVLLGVPPIAWIVLAMIWFGGTNATVQVVILVTASPIPFAGAAEGIATRDRGLDDMARAFGAGPLRRFLDVGLPQAAASLFPAFSLALGMAFKVAVMAELLANAYVRAGQAGLREQRHIAQGIEGLDHSIAPWLMPECSSIYRVRSPGSRSR